MELTGTSGWVVRCPVYARHIIVVAAAEGPELGRTLASEISGCVVGTLRVWLNSNARLSATAATLDISVPGARKRVARLEQVLGRSLLHTPSARLDLWLAMRAANLGRHG
jgi:sugar diacid utilization regulator